MIKVGDKVEALDEAIIGVVLKIKGNKVTIETEDGFDLEFSIQQQVLSHQNEIDSNIFSNQSLSEVVSEKEEKKKRSVKKKTKERFQPTMEIDLHIDKLVPSTRGMSKHDILTHQLNVAKQQLEFAMSKRIQKVVFIHGVGEGVLKLELEYLFKRYDKVKFYDANYQKYGLGATEVYIYQNQLGVIVSEAL